MPDNVELGRILRATEALSRDARAAFDATGRLMACVGPRLSALEVRLSALESRVGGMDHGLDGLAGANYRIETVLADIASRMPPIARA